MRKLLCVSVVFVGLALIRPVTAADPTKGKVLFEEWYSSPTNDITDNVDTLKSNARYPNNPDKAYWSTIGMDRPDGGEDYWGCRGRAYLVPPQTGDYTFWTASDDDSELWLSTDEDPAHATMIANVEGWTNYRDFAGSVGAPGANMKSQPVKLEAGKRYYIECVQSDGTGGGFVTIAWGGPGIGAGPTVIDAKYFYAFLRSPEPLLMAGSPDPADGALGVTLPMMQWTSGVTALWHNVYFGTDPNPPFVTQITYTLYYDLNGLEPGVTYYWKVDEVEADGVTTYAGPVWSFVAQGLTNYYPQPDDGASSVSPLVTLTWEPGRDAVKHHVYFGEDRDAVAAGDAATDKGEVTEVNDVTAFTPGELAGATTFYWRVDAIDGDGNVRTGEVWSFTTYILVDEFESYDDEEGTGTRIYETWIDGYTDGLSGSTIGNLDPPFAEQTIVHGGTQSMPMDYNNINSPYFSSGYREFSPVMDWTVNGVTDLSLWVRGRPAPVDPVVEDNGKMTVSGEGVDIWGAADQFTFVYKTLNGDGSLVAHVVSIGAGSNTWAKGGVMIRDSLDAGSASAQMELTANNDGTAGNGAAFQNRATADLDMGANDSTSNTTSTDVIAPPYWVKIERTGDTLKASVSPDNKTWTQFGTSQYIFMTNPVYIGLCVTSHQPGEYRTFEFDNVKATGASGNWRTTEVGLTRNSEQPLYVTVEDSTGKKVTVVDPNEAVTTTTWTEWKIPLTDLAGISLTKVKKLTIGVGDPDNPAPDGYGRVYIDDIRVTKPAPEVIEPVPDVNEPVPDVNEPVPDVNEPVPDVNEP